MNAMKTRYWLSAVWGILATACVSILVRSLENATGALYYLNSLVNQRGSSSYLILSFGFTVLFFAARAIRLGDFRPRLSALLIMLSVTPIIWGVMGWQMGLVSVDASYRTQLATTPSADKIADIESMRAMGIAISFDPMLLSIVVSVVVFSVSFMHWTLAGGAVLIPPTAMPERRIALFKPWFAYHVMAGILSLLAGGSIGLLCGAMFRVLDLNSGPIMTLCLYVLGFLVSILVSFPIFKWVLYRMILSQIRPEGITPNNH